MTDCDLCVQLYGRLRPATVDAAVPMAGERPHYNLCDDCLRELDEYIEDVKVLS